MDGHARAPTAPARSSARSATPATPRSGCAEPLAGRGAPRSTSRTRSSVRGSRPSRSTRTSTSRATSPGGQAVVKYKAKSRGLARHEGKDLVLVALAEQHVRLDARAPRRAHVAGAAAAASRAEPPEPPRAYRARRVRAGCAASGRRRERRPYGRAHIEITKDRRMRARSSSSAASCSISTSSRSRSTRRGARSSRRSTR